MGILGDRFRHLDESVMLWRLSNPKQRSEARNLVWNEFLGTDHILEEAAIASSTGNVPYVAALLRHTNHHPANNEILSHALRARIAIKESEIEYTPEFEAMELGIQIDSDKRYLGKLNPKATKPLFQR